MFTFNKFIEKQATPFCKIIESLVILTSFIQIRVKSMGWFLIQIVEEQKSEKPFK